MPSRLRATDNRMILWIFFLTLGHGGEVLKRALESTEGDRNPKGDHHAAGLIPAEPLYN